MRGGRWLRCRIVREGRLSTLLCAPASAAYCEYLLVTLSQVTKRRKGVCWEMRSEVTGRRDTIISMTWNPGTTKVGHGICDRFEAGSTYFLLPQGAREDWQAMNDSRSQPYGEHKPCKRWVQVEINPRIIGRRWNTDAKRICSVLEYRIHRILEAIFII